MAITKKDIDTIAAAIRKVSVHPASDSVTVNAISAVIEEALYDLANPKHAAAFACRANGGVIVLGKALGGLDRRQAALSQSNEGE